MSGVSNPRSDTSSSASGRPPTTIPAYVQPHVPKYTNPLLSAAVTNLTLDDFTHNAVLLPAALPVIAAPVISPPSAAGFVNQHNTADVFQHSEEAIRQNDLWSNSGR